MKPSLYILAAGMGSRYGGLKQLDGVGPNDETIMDYSVFDAIRAGFGKVVFVIRKDFEADFREKILSKYQNHIPLEIVFQSIDALPAGFSVPIGREKPWGTNHAVMMASKVINEPFLVINADDFYGYDTFRAAAEFLSGDLKNGEYCMVGFSLGNTLSETGAVSRGICDVGANGYLKKVVEHKDIKETGGIIRSGFDGGQVLAPGTVVSMNAWGFTPDYFKRSEEYFRDVFLPANIDNLKSEFFIPMMVDDMISSGYATVKCLDTDAVWFGVTYAEDRPAVVQKLKEMTDAGVYPDKLFN